jgi:hypothetical protein
LRAGFCQRSEKTFAIGFGDGYANHKSTQYSGETLRVKICLRLGLLLCCEP